jgi:hypothetical protein
MTNAEPVFIGIDPAQKGKTISYAALDGAGQILFKGSSDLEQVIAFVAEQAEARIAINAPASLNRGIVSSSGITNKYRQSRQAEFDLYQQGIPVPRTPAVVEKAPAWMRKGFSLYQRLEEMGYQSSENGQPNGKSYLETQVDGCCAFWIQATLFKPGTVESRIQRQLLLVQRKVRVKDPMLFFEEITRFKLLHGILPIEHIYALGELNALICAEMARISCQSPQDVIRLGSAQEGLIHLPRKVEG